jgi:hypothetical protein
MHILNENSVVVFRGGLGEVYGNFKRTTLEQPYFTLNGLELERVGRSRDRDQPNLPSS